ncbi:MAG: type I-C CRISPR-associated protein Cas8c/Csd1 [Deltaproteobacteria bacterium CG_4_8_14_3_um_filter_51_11]|nr:type I-C CRISPR-associated protein Cas8c/Csd1 [bacterium]NCP08876.1 type I-C CRISPR-associated protein Cas8c/Csd1 [bacterium]OIP39572.1 MAG: type I-C CRISPR-associated protein Cas8c/Csd1 [Desulfobacteraceae bacterium CG2_30_51_40]PIX20953.1 MAG: type I-C CRISPR-associated protein Cas8c/Csd1 [Deltaproteobacteria bacterium CG_4_8_14_3_um_filter_51_11]PIY22877.1 MAG: type I-C CRISPR-associated protein Cas8c/Csd1 [Deltaproteobacteria bacterium CG_4_10_14_3_um_filter_51_14]
MILQSLFNYYQILLKDDSLGIATPGYSAANVSFALNLSPAGELLDIFPFTTKFFDGKKERERNYRRMVVPEQVKRTVGISANFMCDNSAYVLGVSGKEAKDLNYAEKRFSVFRLLNAEILAKANSAVARAVIAFLERHEPQTALQHPVIARHLEALLKGGNLIFQVNGENALDDPEIRRAWEEYKLGQDAVQMQCLVTGEVEPIARLHPSIQGVRAANPTGASLVGFNERAYESYNRIKGQGLNSPVSQRVASGYGVALNYLLSNQNPNRKIYLGDTTVVYWAESENKGYASAFAALINPEFLEAESAEDQIPRKKAEKKMGETAEKVQKGQALDVAKLREGLDESTRFYVLGLASNAARLAVRFYLTEPFGVFAERIMQHYDDLKIEKEFANQADYLSPYRILAECVSPKVTRRDDEVKQSWSLMGGALMRAVLMGLAYPEGLHAAMLNRIRHDSDDEKRSVKINYIRAAYIKAHLIRKYRHQDQNPYQEALQMSLNESFTHPAYVLGRLFAVLEKTQREAIGQNMNATIKDRYFTSASATPASVFPILLRLAHHWTAKAEYGGISDRRIQDLLGLLDAKPFPSRLTLDEQGVFVLGYYHQRAGFYSKNGEKAEETE